MKLSRIKKLYIKKREIINQLIRYGIVGIVNTIVGYGIYFLFLYVGLKYQIALSIGSVFGITCSYLLNKFWTFSSKKKVLNELPKFFIVYFISYLINLLLLVLLVEEFKIDEKIAQLFVIVIITCITFIGNKFWSFKKNSNKQKG